MGSFITTLPEDRTLDSTSIFTQAIKFSDRDDEIEDEDLPSTGDNIVIPSENQPTPEEDQQPGSDEEGWAQVADPFKRSLRSKRQFGDIIDGITGNIGGGDQEEGDKEPSEEQLEDWETWQPLGEDASASEAQQEGDDNVNQMDEEPQPISDEPLDQPSDEDNGQDQGQDQPSNDDQNEQPSDDQNDQPGDDQNDQPSDDQSNGGNGNTIIDPSGNDNTVVTYSRPISYSVKKTGYYCIGELTKV